MNSREAEVKAHLYSPISASGSWIEYNSFDPEGLNV
jgi:hypothetical protein